jgi:hypothetical protein
MQGKIFLKTTIEHSAIDRKGARKTAPRCRFEISQGKFLHSTIQDQIDSLSRAVKAKPKNQAIDEVVSVMAGKFILENDVITSDHLSFAVPGSGVETSCRKL